MLGQHLEDEGYTCVLHTSPPQALEALATGSYSLLLTDLKMPEMYGLDVVRRAKKLDPDLAIIVITALLDVTNAIDAIRAGADDYLLKPFNLSEITLAVESALEKRRLIQENKEYQHRLEDRVRAATHDLELANQELRRTKEYLENLIDSSVDAIVTVDHHSRISYINQGGLQMTGYQRDEVFNHPLHQFLGAGRQEVRHLMVMLKEKKRLQNYETDLRKHDGGYMPVNISLSLVRGSDGKVISTLAICKDITEQKRLEQELKEMSIKDSLTGLYNQRYFYDRLEAEIERARRQGHPLSLLLFDIDLFKTYNDCHGHLGGDNVLQALGEVVQECTREHVDIGFRYGGDEFTVILPEASEKQALAIAERIRTTFLERRFDNLTLSIGLMSYRQGSSLRTFIRFTDAMMYDAKRSGGNRVIVYDHALDPDHGTALGEEENRNDAPAGNP
jgi:diguanylate cyclase (GGDEF)-like protein/PAS domain S-box-containing protein